MLKGTDNNISPAEDFIDSKADKITEDETSRMISEKLNEYLSSPQDDEHISSEQPLSDAKEKKPAGKTAKNLNAGHRGRMREKFLASGFDGFAPHEIIEMLLYYTVPRKDTNKTAHELINRFGSVAGVFNADIEQLTSVTDVSENAAVLFKMIPKILPVYYSDMSKGISYNDTTKLKELFRPYFVGVSKEIFYIACFDNNLKLISVDRISEGAPGTVDIRLRRVVECVIRSGCTMAALAHNHPCGSPKPSNEDISVTRRIGTCLSDVDVKLMDHIIAGEGSAYSMRDNGDLGVFD
ncbi:MAG: RadC family protein [Huintestinicola sp.]